MSSCFRLSLVNDLTLKVLKIVLVLHLRNFGIFGCVTCSFLSPTTRSGEFGAVGSLVSLETRFERETKWAGALTLELILRGHHMSFLSVA